MVAIGVYEGWKVLRRGASKSLPGPVELPDESEASPEWRALCEQSSAVIERILDELPPDITSEARKVPCLFREEYEKEDGGYIRFGEYHNFVPGRKSDHLGPIILFLKSIREWCEERGENFEAEVRYTYLHELGHHFGWDEVDLARHGLPSGRPPGMY